MFQLSRTKVESPTTGEVLAGRSEIATGSTSTGRPDDPAGDFRVLGLSTSADWSQIRAAHARLVADLTPGPDASHGKVALAQRYLDEVNGAFEALRARSSVA